MSGCLSPGPASRAVGRSAADRRAAWLAFASDGCSRCSYHAREAPTGDSCQRYGYHPRRICDSRCAGDTDCNRPITWIIPLVCCTFHMHAYLMVLINFQLHILSQTMLWNIHFPAGSGIHLSAFNTDLPPSPSPSRHVPACHHAAVSQSLIRRRAGDRRGVPAMSPASADGHLSLPGRAATGRRRQLMTISPRVGHFKPLVGSGSLATLRKDWTSEWR